MDERDPKVPEKRAQTIPEPANEPPVVARMVIEIRSDGRTTIARGAMEDNTLGQRVAIEAHGNSPMELALSLAKSMLKVPTLAAQAARALLPAAKKPRR